MQDLDAAGRVYKNQNNYDYMLSDAGRQDLERANRLMADTKITDAINAGTLQLPANIKKAWGLLDKDDIKKLWNDNASKVRWATDNFDSLRDMNEMRKSPFMWLLSALFSGDPSRLYRALGGLNKMFDAREDAYWDKLGEDPEFSGYKGWMPLLRALHNLRGSISGGPGFEYLSEG